MTIQSYPVDQLRDFITPRYEKKIEQQKNTVQRLPHSNCKIAISFILGIIVTIGALYLTIHYGISGLNTGAHVAVGTISWLVGCGSLVYAVFLLCQNQKKQAKAEASSSKQTPEDVLECLKEEIPALLKKGEFFIVQETGCNGRFVFMPLQIAQLLPQRYIKTHSGHYRSLILQEIDRDLPHLLGEPKKVVSKEELLARKKLLQEKRPKEAPSISKQCKDGPVAVTNANSIPPATEQYTSQAVLFFDFLLTYQDSFVPEYSQTLEIETLEEVILLAKEMSNQQILDYLEDVLSGAASAYGSETLDLLALARRQGLMRLEEACFYSLLKYPNLKQTSIRVPAKILMSKLLDYSEQCRVDGMSWEERLRPFDFTHVEQIRCDLGFSDLPSILHAKFHQLTRLEHISVRQTHLFQPIFWRSVDSFISGCEQLPALQLIDFAQAKVLGTKLNDLGNSTFSIYPSQEPVFVKKGADAEALVRKYKLKLTF